MRLNHHWVANAWLGPTVLALVVGLVVLVGLGRLGPEALISVVTLLVPNPLEKEDT
jgi:hypothetical protein